MVAAVSSTGAFLGLMDQAAQPRAPRGISMKWVKSENSTTVAAASVELAPHPTSATVVAASVTPRPPGVTPTAVSRRPIA